MRTALYGNAARYSPPAYDDRGDAAELRAEWEQRHKADALAAARDDFLAGLSSREKLLGRETADEFMSGEWADATSELVQRAMVLSLGNDRDGEWPVAVGIMRGIAQHMASKWAAKNWREYLPQDDEEPLQ